MTVMSNAHNRARDISIRGNGVLAADATPAAATPDKDVSSKMPGFQ